VSNGMLLSHNATWTSNLEEIKSQKGRTVKSGPFGYLFLALIT
jgi:hypothetical protein